MEKLLKGKIEPSKLKIDFSIACEILHLQDIYKRSLQKNYLQNLTLQDWEKLFKKDNLL